MPKMFAVAAGIAVLGAAGAAHAAASYAGVTLGAGLSGDLRGSLPAFGATGSSDLETGFVGGFVMGKGYDVGAGGRVSVEAEALYAKNDVDGADEDIASYGGFVNVRYMQLVRDRTIGPYVGLGIGYGHSEFKDGALNLTLKDDGFAWQAMAGVLVGVSDNMALDLGYRYIEPADIDDTLLGATPIGLDTRIHALTLGARFSF
ncbi:MAG: outer membrane protein [Hyphomonadaceae bacterium]